ncbi:APC family permease [Mesomycoplasma hyorhinis]|uniref:Amino acid permease n=2 Tax=Mesomycoplasma hyorhinis TaxID=2100 RepID=A0AAJ2YNQ7_MESHY|nr:APC family permease [Mesomycoplasma hyorhinis]ADM21986.1 Amino acid permease [Mesomycoplasma hyorhinis HUB-1]AFX74511.1 Amino acid permease [Mesomycoplasma hyorhinis SK76]MXR06298.1 amino acid permease [Mesomycoplasma hyorhinis]MXR07027.1 amino acid permease [Mesomycoplasma hyorhinis]MXR09267.1 amino acid permease [Mesomycoplasma hyorhinis]
MQASSDQKLAKRQKISFASALLIVLGSCIGAGIFFKSRSVLEGSGYYLTLAIFAWVLSSFAIIAMAFSLLEISSVSTHSNNSLIEWNKRFNSQFIYKLSRNFIIFIYLPLTYFSMPLYFVQTLQDAYQAFSLTPNADFHFHLDWFIVLIIVLVFVYYFALVGLSSKLANWHNKIILVFKFLPIILVVVVSFIMFSSGGAAKLNSKPVFVDIKEIVENKESLKYTIPGFGFVLSLAAIFFTYEGFFAATGIQSEMKEPKKTPLAILFGLIIVTVIYLLLAIAMSIVGDGSISSFIYVLKNDLKWNDTLISNVLGFTNIFIALGILGILNAFTLWGPRLVEELILQGDFKFLSKYKSKLNVEKPIVGTIILLLFSTVFIIILFLIGTFAFIDDSKYNNYGVRLDSLYSLADILGNWSALISFAFIGIAIFGGLKNRKTNKVKVTKFKYFVPFSIISLVVIWIILIFSIGVPILDLLALFWIKDAQDILVPRLIKVLILVAFFAISGMPIFFEYLKNKRNVKKKKNLQQS